MAGLQNTHWAQWDNQEEQRIENLRFVELNNLYLQIERGQIVLTITNANRLRVLAGQIWAQDDPMLDYWMTEFQKLPNWLEV